MYGKLERNQLRVHSMRAPLIGRSFCLPAYGEKYDKKVEKNLMSDFDCHLVGGVRGAVCRVHRP